MPFSLILATVGRVEETREFLASLGDAALVDEVVVVDQNRDERLVPVLAAFPYITFKRLRMEPGNSSAARNFGAAHASGEFVAFPDDDCTYAPDLLARVAARLATLPAPGLVAALVADVSGTPSTGGRAPVAAVPVSRDNVFVTAREPGMFLPRAVFGRAGGFDPRFGVGAPFASCESADLALRLLEAGIPTLFDPALVVRHLDTRLSARGLARARGQAAGFGACLRRHHYGAGTIFRYLARPLGALLLGLVRADRVRIAFYAATLRGRFQGYTAWRGNGTP